MTRREEIIKLLSEKKLTANSIAKIFDVELSEIIEDLEHIKKSIKPKKLKQEPAYCKKCSFTFKERDKIRKPSKCPKCKSEWIQEALFYIN